MEYEMDEADIVFVTQTLIQQKLLLKEEKFEQIVDRLEKESYKLVSTCMYLTHARVLKPSLNLLIFQRIFFAYDLRHHARPCMFFVNYFKPWFIVFTETFLFFRGKCAKSQFLSNSS